MHCAGASRYIPGGSSSQSGFGGTSGASDPFTGAGRYQPGTQSSALDGSQGSQGGGADPFTGKSCIAVALAAFVVKHA